MKFPHNSLFAAALLVALMHGSLNAFESAINLAGRKDLVLRIEARETVLEVGRDVLAPKTDDFLSSLADLPDPFAFKASTPVVPVVADDTAVEEEPEPPAVVYEDAEVLALAAASFAEKVRGSIVRGDSSFLQLEGGALLKTGTSFPVRLPRAKDQTFTLTITEITSEGYTLQIGEATGQFNFNGKPNSNSIQFTNP